MPKICKKCQEVEVKKSYLFCDPCLQSERKMLKRLWKENNIYTPPAIHEERGRSQRTISQIDGGPKYDDHG